MAVKRKHSRKKSYPSTPTARSPDSRKKKSSHGDQTEIIPRISSEMKEISELFQDLHFQKRILGGIDEMDVWRQLREVQQEYETLLRIRDEQNKALLKERDEQLLRLKRRILEIKSARGETGE